MKNTHSSGEQNKQLKKCLLNVPNFTVNPCLYLVLGVVPWFRQSAGGALSTHLTEIVLQTVQNPLPAVLELSLRLVAKRWRLQFVEKAIE